MSEYIPVPLLVAPSTTHTIYVRRQLYQNAQQSDSDSDSDSDQDSAVFVTNLPLDTTQDNAKDICKALGDVVLDEYVYQGGRHGLFKLVDDSAADRFLAKAKKISKKGQIRWQQYGPRGTDGYLARHYAKFPEEADLQEKVDEYMTLFAEKEEREAEEAARAAEEVDSEGFRIVRYNKRKLGAGAPMKLEDLPPPKKKKTLEKTDFYRFQLRERRKEEMSDLLKRFQRDKEKVEELKQKKHFKPY